MKYHVQGRCGVCYKGMPTTVFSVCELLDEGYISPYFCDTRSGRDCVSTHLADVHS